jgi:hypothetical protein
MKTERLRELAKIRAAERLLVREGWRIDRVSDQVMPDGTVLPINALVSGDGPIQGIVTAGFHAGDEQAGVYACADPDTVRMFVEVGARTNIIVMMINSPRAFVEGTHYVDGKSPGDCGHLFDNKKAPACRQAVDIARYFANQSIEGAEHADLHEDPGGAPMTYMYAVGALNKLALTRYPLVKKMAGLMVDSGQPLAKSGTETPFGDVEKNGVLYPGPDDSFGWYLAAMLGVKCGVTVENHVYGRNNPPLRQRVEIHKQAIKILLEK